jgi:phosphate transport system substrate-binding protein
MDTTLLSQNLRRWQWVGLLALGLVLIGCSNATASTQGTGCASTTMLNGAGSTFDAPLFNKQFAVYPTVPCGLTVNYYPLGSSVGIAQLLNQQVDFGATDAPLTDRQLAASPNGTILHVPVTLGVVAISYRLAEVAGPP